MPTSPHPDTPPRAPAVGEAEAALELEVREWLKAWGLGRVPVECDAVFDNARRLIISHKFLGAPLPEEAAAEGDHWTLAGLLAPLPAATALYWLEAARVTLWAAVYREAPPAPIVRQTKGSLS